MVGEDAMRKNYYYEIKFKDGRYVRREYVTKKIALAVYEAMAYEMVFFDVEHISCGVMQ
jgi:hypothetical protein